jgi:hypothetical protein
MAKNKKSNPSKTESNPAPTETEEKTAPTPVGAKDIHRSLPGNLITAKAFVAARGLPQGAVTALMSEVGDRNRRGLADWDKVWKKIAERPA